MTTEELKYLEIPDLNKKYEVGVTTDVLNGALDLKADAIEETASGAIASFTDGADDVPVKSLKVNIAPKQSGSGDPSPSNVRPISGWDEVEVDVCGKNHVQPTTTTSGYGLTINVASDGTVTINGTSTALKDIEFATYMPANTPITLSLNNNIADVNMTAYLITPTGTGNPSTSLGVVNRTFTLTPTTDIVLMRVRVPSGTTLNNFVMKPQIELGSTATAYEPYQAETKSISLPSTVYGGTLDVVSGEGKSNRELYNLKTHSADYILSYDYDGKHGVFINYALSTTETRASGACNVAPVVTTDSYSGSQYMWFGVNSSAVFWIGILDVLNMTLAEFKTWLASNDVIIARPKATPTDFTTDPTEVTTLLGSNNIWSDAGTVEVEYRADTTLAYNKLLSLIANS